MDDKKCGACCGLNPCALGMSFGITWGLGLLLLSFISIFLHMGTPMVDVLGSVYKGYDATVVGALIGFVWGVVDGMIFGVVCGFIYNKVLKCHSCKMCGGGKCDNK